MKSKALKTLEYNKIIELLSNQATSKPAKEQLLKLQPMTNVGDIKDALAETSEAVRVIMLKGPAPLGQIYDIEDALYFARKGGSLTMRQLLQVLYNLKVTSNVISFLKSDLPQLPIIDSIREVLVTFPRLVENIDRCILSEDEMSDNASPELKSIRRSIARQTKCFHRQVLPVPTRWPLNLTISLFRHHGPLHGTHRAYQLPKL